MPTDDVLAEPGTDLATADPQQLADMAAAMELLAAGAGTPTGLRPIPAQDEVRTLAALAVTLTAAAACPRALRDKPNDAFLVMLEGRALGLAPTTAMRMLHVIDGTVTVPPKMKQALLNQLGLGETWAHRGPHTDPATGELRLCECGSADPDNDAERATWHARRRGQVRVESLTYTWAQAQRAGLVLLSCDADQHSEACQKNSGRGATGPSCKQNWRNYPERMLSWRALGYLLDDVFPEVSGGLYSPDELGAVTDDDGEVIDVTSWEAPSGLTRTAAAKAAPPDPRDDVCPDDERASYLHRIDALAALDGSYRLAIVNWWKESGPPMALPELTVRWSKVLAAKLDQVERLAGTEHPGWHPAPMDGPEAPADDPPATTPPEPDPTPDVAPQPEVTPDAPVPTTEQAEGYDPADPPADIVEALIAYLAASSKEALQAALEQRGAPRTGNPAALRQRLGNLLLGEGWRPRDGEPHLAGPELAEPEQQALA